MKQLKEEELKNIEGGGIGVALIFGIIALGTLIVGIVDGYVRPLKCNE